MSFESYELLLKWLDKETFKSSKKIHETEIHFQERRPEENWMPNVDDSEVADDRAFQADIDHERKKLAAYAKLRELMLRRPERKTFEVELKKEYSARATVEAINLLGEEARRYLLRTLALLLDEYACMNDSLSARTRSGGDSSALEKDIVTAKNLSLSLARTSYGTEVQEDDLCDLVADPYKWPQLVYALMMRKPSPEESSDSSVTDPNSCEIAVDSDVEQAARSVSFDASGYTEGLE